MEAQSNIAKIKAAGYRVFVSKAAEPTYCYYTDGTNIGYAQWNRMGDSVSSVQVPNRTSGTGFIVADVINADTLKEALVGVAPSWATREDRGSVKKFSDFAAFQKTRFIPLFEA